MYTGVSPFAWKKVETSEKGVVSLNLSGPFIAVSTPLEPEWMNQNSKSDPEIENTILIIFVLDLR